MFQKVVFKFEHDGLDNVLEACNPGVSIEILAWGGHMAEDKGPMGWDWRVIRDKIKGTKKID